MYSYSRNLQHVCPVYLPLNTVYQNSHLQTVPTHCAVGWKGVGGCPYNVCIQQAKYIQREICVHGNVFRMGAEIDPEKMKQYKHKATKKN